MAGKGSVKRNIYKLDDYCLTISYILILPLLFKALSYLTYLGLPVETIRPLVEKLSKDFFFLSIFIISIIFLQIVGRTVRNKKCYKNLSTLLWIAEVINNAKEGVFRRSQAKADMLLEKMKSRFNIDQYEAKPI